MTAGGATASDVASVHVVVPGDVDDVTAPSGGNVFDRRVNEGLAAAGRPVREIAVPGAWPRPDAFARGRLSRSLAALPDGAVVLLDGLVACGVPDIVVPQARRLRVAVLVHLPLGDETGLTPALATELDALERETLRGVGLVVATSPWAARRLAEHHGLPADRVHVVTPGTDPAPLAPGTDGASRLLCVASVTPRKGQDRLVEALAAVADLPWSCVCVGPLGRDPEYVARLRELIAQHGLGDRVRLAGPLTGEPLETAYAAADLLVLPSRAETYGMVVTEALMRGIPVLATATGGVPDALGRAPDGSLPGVLVPAQEPPHENAALAEALRGWLEDGGLRHRLRTSARQRRDTLQGWDEVSQRMDAVLDLLREGSS
ncbi:glycosyltransferase family 4 protein [Streptomyces sp. NPDC059373]